MSHLRRPSGQVPYRKLYVIAAEGAKTDPQYFSMFVNSKSIIRVKFIKGHNESSPPQVLKRMNKYLNDMSLRKTDEAWLVVDKDNWTDDQLSQLYEWSIKKPNYGFALSNPRFEYWLILHFENGTGVSNSRECIERLLKYLPDYDKRIKISLFNQSLVLEAVNRAKQRDVSRCEDWPRTLGTTVYKLVESILGA